MKSPHPGKSGDDLNNSPTSRRLAQSSIDGPAFAKSKDKYNTARRLNPLNNSIDIVFGPSAEHQAQLDRNRGLLGLDRRNVLDRARASQRL